MRRPTVPPESPTLGLAHPQFEAMLTTARESVNANDFALAAMLGMLGLRILATTGADIDLGEEHAIRPRPQKPGPGTLTTFLPPTWPREPDRSHDPRPRIDRGRVEAGGAHLLERSVRSGRVEAAACCPV